MSTVKECLEHLLQAKNKQIAALLKAGVNKAAEISNLRTSCSAVGRQEARVCLWTTSPGSRTNGNTSSYSEGGSQAVACVI